MSSASPCPLTLVISSLHGGGAERVMAELANAWAGCGHAVNLVTTGFRAKDDFYPLDSRVGRLRLDDLVQARRKSVRVQWRRFTALRNVLRAAQGNVVLSFMAELNVIVLLASAGLGLRVIVSERSDPRRGDIGWIWRWLRRVTYPLADCVVVQTERVAQWMRENIPKAKVRVIPNPIPAELLARPVPPLPEGPRRRLVAMGRLSWEKGYADLIGVFAQLAGEFPEWDLWIWGDGPLRDRLQAQIRGHGLEQRVFLPGRTRAPWDELAKADIFVLSSVYEGFPNVMLEAMALGRPCVAFDCAGGGPRELSRNGQDAVLVPAGDFQRLRETLTELMSDPEKRGALHCAASHVRDRFALHEVVRSWRTLLDPDVGGLHET